MYLFDRLSRVWSNVSNCQIKSVTRTADKITASFCCKGLVCSAVVSNEGCYVLKTLPQTSQLRLLETRCDCQRSDSRHFQEARKQAVQLCILACCLNWKCGKYRAIVRIWSACPVIKNMAILRREHILNLLLKVFCQQVQYCWSGLSLYMRS